MESRKMKDIYIGDDGREFIKEVLTSDKHGFIWKNIYDDGYYKVVNIDSDIDYHRKDLIKYMIKEKQKEIDELTKEIKILQDKL